MEIWYISKYVAPPKYTRVGTRGYQLSKELSKRGHNVTLYTSDANHLAQPPQIAGAFIDEVLERVNIRWIKTKKYTRVHSLGRILSWISFDINVLRNRKDTKPDIVIVSSLSLTTILIGIIFKFLYRNKLVFEIRDIWPLVLCESGGYSKFNPAIIFLKIVELIGYRFSDLIVGTMPNLQEYIDTVQRKERKVLCIPHGIDPKGLQDDTDQPAVNIQTYLRAEQSFIVCYAGSMGEDNALETLILAAKKLDHINEIAFLLIGDGDMRDKYEQMALEAKNIIFTGMLPKHEVTSLISQVNILYFATHSNKLSKYGQSLNKIIDYMAAGKVILGSYSGYPSMINEAKCGEFIPENSVDDLVNTLGKYLKMEPYTIKEIGERGRAWLVRERSFENLAEQYESALKKLQNDEVQF